jgi:outer membrane protein assembly factor BamE
MNLLLTTYIKSGRFFRAPDQAADSLATGPVWPRAARQAAALAVLASALTGCNSIPRYFPAFLTPYRPDVQQGNVITSEMVEQLRPGMTRDQVRFMLGTPLLTDAFHKDRWDYLYYLSPRKGSTQRRNLVIYFADNRVDRFHSDPMPPESMADNLILGRKNRRAAAPKPPPVQSAVPSAATSAAESSTPDTANAPNPPTAPGSATDAGSSSTEASPAPAEAQN